MSDSVKYYQDDSYFIFSSEDIRPFISIFEYYLLEKKDQVLLILSTEICK